jgi:predicted Zn finger-like uncharacterized protein
MILQCDQCSTKFRLDDAKLKPGGVKVRCSKCRHVFLAGAEPKHEESEFDAILSGLGAPAPEKSGDAASAGAGADLAGFGFDEEFVAVPAASALPTQPAAPDQLAPAKPEPAPYSPAAAVSHEAALETEPKSAPETDTVDFAAFDFPTEAFESPEPHGSQAASEPDFSSFDFEPEPLPLEPQAGAAAPGLDYGEFSFDEEPAQLKEESAPEASNALDFGEFSFAAEPEPSREKTPPAALGFGEFEFNEEPTQRVQEPPALDGLDYGDFSFPAEPGPKLEEPALATRNEKAPAAAEDSFDFGAFSFSEEPAMLQEEPAAEARQDLDFGEFSFAEEPPLPREAAAPAAGTAPDADAFSFSEPSPIQKTQPAPQADDGFNFEDFSFSQDLGAKPAPASQVGTAAPQAGFPEAPPAAPSLSAKEASLPLDGESELDFGLGTTPPTRVPEQFELDEEGLPPLSIASRRKGRSLLAISVIVISVLVIVALSGAGFYLLQSGPDAFDKLGLGFVAQWFGVENAEEGRITIRNQQASFAQNKEAGELFVVTGEAVNSFRKARASILVKVSIFDKKGAVLLHKSAYCGNRLSSVQLATLPMAKIESIMNNQFGDSLSNLGVQPGKAIGFVVALANVPKEAADFGVEVVSSTVAGK